MFTCLLSEFWIMTLLSHLYYNMTGKLCKRGQMCVMEQLIHEIRTQGRKKWDEWTVHAWTTGSGPSSQGQTVETLLLFNTQNTDLLMYLRNVAPSVGVAQLEIL